MSSSRKKVLSPKDEFLKKTVRKDPKACCASRCKGKRPGTSRQYCWKCDKRWWRHSHVRLDRWGNLRNNAMRRGIKFDLSFAEFNKICDLTGYTSDGHVQFGDRMSLDRLRLEEGYVLSNLRVISVRENSRRWANPRILVGDVWLDHECVSFDDDPLKEARAQAVRDKLEEQYGPESGRELVEEPLPNWLLRGPNDEIDEPF